MNAFDHQLPRAINLVKSGYAMTEVTMLIRPECETTEEAHLLARAAETFVKMLRRNGRRRVQWF